MDSPDSRLDALISAAEEAERAGELAVAASAWQVFRFLAPDDPNGFLEGAKLLRRFGQLREAAALLQQGRDRFPNHEWIAVEHAWGVQELGDQDAALVCWRGVCERFPNNLSGYVGVGFTLRRLGNFDAADDIYRSALERFPPNEALYTEFAWSAEEQRGISESIRRWDKVRAHFPDVQVSYVRAGILLRDSARYLEADAVLKRATERFPDNVEAAISYAWVAHRQRDWPEALKRWELLILKFPDLAEGRCGATEALMDLGRYAEAANVLSPAARMFPDNLQVAVLGARLAALRGDTQEALAKWKDIHDRFPANADAWRGYAAALRDAGRVEEAESTMLECSRRFPDDPRIAADLAQLPERNQNWPLAIERWRQVLGRFSHLPGAYAGLGNSLLQAGRVKEAQATFQSARDRFAGNIDLAVAEAEGFEQLKDWQEALRLWASLAEQHPMSPAGFLGLGRVLRESGQAARSVEVLTDALRRFPQNLELEIQLALALGSTGEWQLAVARWEQLRQRFPRAHLLSTRAYKMMEAARLEQPELFAVPPGDSIDPVDAAGDSKGLAALLKRFESLGDDCEFGLVQRIFQADALGLLRWARTLPADFLKALEAKFDGVGNPEHTIIRIQGYEYMTEDRRFSMVSHTFTPPSMTPLEEFSVEQCRRMQWLRRKLLDDLSNARKIFVYKTESVSDDEVLAIYSALLRYSRNVCLLFVRLQNGGHPAGTLQRVTGNLFVGYMDKFSTVDISVSIWVRLCLDVAAQLDVGAGEPKVARLS